MHCASTQYKLVSQYRPQLASQTHFHQHVDVLLVFERLVQSVTTDSHVPYSFINFFLWLTDNTVIGYVHRYTAAKQLEIRYDIMRVLTWTEKLSVDVCEEVRSVHLFVYHQRCSLWCSVLSTVSNLYLSSSFTERCLLTLFQVQLCGACSNILQFYTTLHRAVLSYISRETIV